MIHLLSITSVLRIVAVIYAIMLLAVLSVIIWINGDGLGVAKTLVLAISLSGALQVILLFFFFFGWRAAWYVLPQLNKWVFPNISGNWDMSIRLEDGRIIKANAIVRQTFTEISMDVSAPDSRSVTLSAIPKKASESKLPLLYYIFQVTTRPDPVKKLSENIYRGAAILDISHFVNDEVSGNYWTTVPSRGTYILTRRH